MMPEGVKDSSVASLSEVLDVQLLDVFAQLETILRAGRQIQREALRARGVPSPVSRSTQRASVRKIHQLLSHMSKECRALCSVVVQVRSTAMDMRQQVRGGRVTRIE